MRKLIVSNLISLDGYASRPGGDVMALPFDTTFSDNNLELMRAADTLAGVEAERSRSNSSSSCRRRASTCSSRRAGSRSAGPGSTRPPTPPATARPRSTIARAC